MARFVRRNIIVFACSFTVPGSTAQPTAAQVELSWLDTNNNQKLVTIPMTYSSTTNQWSASWDSTATPPTVSTKVDWVMSCTGPVQAASEGSIEIVANTANMQP